MKTIIVLFVTLTFGTMFAQNNNVPKVVKAKFKVLYPKAEDVKWDKENKFFEADFDLNDVEMSILIDAKGKVHEIETSLENKELPKAVLKNLAKDFPGYELNEAAKIERNGKTTFEAEIEKDEKKYDAIYSVSGKLLKKNVVNEKD